MYSFKLEKITYNLENEELSSLFEATILIESNKTYYSMFELFNAFYINLLRRIEYFNLEKILELLEDRNSFKKNEDNILKRWKEVDFNILINIAKEYHIINSVSFSILKSFYEFKKNSSLNDDIDKEELYSFFNILKNELLNLKFVMDINKEDISSRKRRETDKIEVNDEEISIKIDNEDELMPTTLSLTELIINNNKEKEKSLENNLNLKIYI